MSHETFAPQSSCSWSFSAKSSTAAEKKHPLMVSSSTTATCKWYSRGSLSGKASRQISPNTEPSPTKFSAVFATGHHLRRPSSSSFRRWHLLLRDFRRHGFLLLRLVSLYPSILSLLGHFLTSPARNAFSGGGALARHFDDERCGMAAGRSSWAKFSSEVAASFPAMAYATESSPARKPGGDTDAPPAKRSSD